MPIHTQWIDVPVADGTTMRAYFARPEPSMAPGLILFQEIFGVNDHIRDLAQRLAHEGFAVLAPELFHRTAPGFDTPYGDYTPGRAEAAKMTLEGMDADFRASYNALKAQGAPTVGCVGFCMGGRMAFLAHGALPLACAASFYGGRMVENLERIPAFTGPHLFIWGGRDTIIPREHREQVLAAMRSAAKPHIEVDFAEADHGFFCDQRPTYHAPSAAVAWPLLLAFLRENLG